MRSGRWPSTGLTDTQVMMALDALPHTPGVADHCPALSH